VLRLGLGLALWLQLGIGIGFRRNHSWSSTFTPRRNHSQSNPHFNGWPVAVPDVVTSVDIVLGI